ncbi:MAG: DUF4864 domain-containing protein [Rubrivivax sp.]|nr:DUF4864 domain-containing protein [Rubrivivax sp.]
MTRGLPSPSPALAWTRRWLGCVALIALLVPAAAGAALLAEPDARAVRQVVEAQLEAFAADDAARAFSYASPSIQAQFGDANNFMAMVRSGYPMVVRPAAVSFFQAQVDGGTPSTVMQLVQLRDREGRLWNASYLLERQTGAGWRISGCVVAADSGRSST